jgi:hypothetical protein
MIQRDTEALTDACNEVGLEANSQKAKYKLMSHHQNAGQTRNTETNSRSFASVAKLNIWERQ